MKQKKGLNDLLIPILLVLVVVPVLVYFHIYESGLSQYDWYDTDDTVYDLYVTGKQTVLLITSGVMLAILAFYVLLYKETCKNMKCLLPVLGYETWMVLSAFGAKDKTLALRGAEGCGESLFVVLCYGVILVYCYLLLQSEADYLTVLKGICVVTVVLGAVGLFQLAGRDLLDLQWVQRLIMPSALEAQYIGKLGDTFSAHTVYSTLFNPNYAAQIFAVFLTFFMYMAFTEQKKKIAVCYLGLCGVLALLLFFTYSRMGLILGIVGAIGALWLAVGNKKKTIVLSIAFVCVVVLLFGLDFVTGGRMKSRLIDAKTDMPISSMTTDEEGIHITYKGEHADVTLADAKGHTGLFGGDGSIRVKDLGETEGIELTLDDHTWYFVQIDGVYYYINDFSRPDTLTDIPKVSLFGLEYLASGRGYVWARTIPVILRRPLFGYGPDNFVAAYPQNDYVGKYYYSKMTNMIMDKAHNGYLQIMVQNGVPALVWLALFVIIWIKRELQTDRQGLLISERMGKAAFLSCCIYLVSLLTCDITLFTMPVMVCIWGISISTQKSSL